MEYLQNYTITTQVVLRPHELSNIKSIIESKIKKTIGTCIKEKGYIIIINDIKEKNTNIISRVSGNCIFNVTHTIFTLKPMIGHIYNVLISDIFKEGIFCEFNHMKILIPVSELSKYSYTNKQFQSDEHVIKQGNRIKIKIKNTRYEEQNYQCIAALVE